jgi:5-methylcytosine-specific restriction endonuclease McrA
MAKRTKFSLKTKLLLPAFLAAGIMVLWNFGPFQSIYILSQLLDPQKLATLEKRGANPRLNKAVFWLNEAREKWLAPEAAISMAQLLDWTTEPRASLVKSNLVRNLKIADELGLLTKDNRMRLRQGQSAMVTRGPCQGESIEIDHIVPVSLAPELGNELANLEMLPKSINRKKSNRVGERQWELAQQFHRAGMLSNDSLAKVRSHYPPSFR